MLGTRPPVPGDEPLQEPGDSKAKETPAPTAGLCAVLEENTARSRLPSQQAGATSCRSVGSLRDALLSDPLMPFLPPLLSHRKSKVEVGSHLGSKVLKLGKQEGLRWDSDQRGPDKGTPRGRDQKGHLLRLLGGSAAPPPSLRCLVLSALQPPEHPPFTLSHSLALVPAFTHTLPSQEASHKPPALPDSCLSPRIVPEVALCKASPGRPLPLPGRCPPGPLSTLPRSPVLPSQHHTSPQGHDCSLQAVSWHRRVPGTDSV